MALAPIGQGVGIDSAILDAHQVGDLMVAHAFSRSIGVPVLPAADGWIEIDQVGTTISSGITAYKIATSTNELSGTWTNATSLVISIHRPTGEVSIGASSLTLGSSNSILDWAELVLQNTDGTSTVLAVQSHRSSNAEPLNAPNGSTLRATYENPFNSMSAIYELSDTASWPATTTDTETSPNSHNTGAIEIKEIPPVIVITEDNTPVVSNTDISLTLTGAGSSQLTGILEQIQGTTITSLPITSWVDTEVVGNTVEITSSQYKYGTHQFKVTNDSGDFATTSRPVSPQNTHSYVDILHVATIYDRIAPISIGNQVEYQRNLYIDGAVTAHTVLINDDGTYTIESGTGGTIPNGTYTFSFKVFDHTDSTWGTPAIQTVIVGEVVTTTDAIDGTITIKEKGTGGKYNSWQPLGEDKTLTITMPEGGFGSGPNVAIFAKWTEGSNGEMVPLDAPQIGDFDTGNYGSGIQSNYFDLVDSSGASMREGGTNLQVDNRRTGFVKVLDPFSEYLESFDMAVPEGKYFSGTSAPETLPAISVLKTAWKSDGPLDSATKADMITGSWAGASFALVGNQAGLILYSTSNFDFGVWNNFTAYQKSGADPFVDAGISVATVSVPSVGTTVATNTTSPTFGGGATAAQYTHVNVPAWLGEGNQDNTQHLLRYYYLAVGPNARASIELGDAAVYENVRNKRLVPPVTWTDTEATISVDYKQQKDMTHWFLTTSDGTKYSGEITYD